MENNIMTTMASTPQTATAIAEVISQVQVARALPRDEADACDRVLVACQREALATRAVYSYSRGGAEVTGASIRLAEAVAREWGNIQYGYRTIAEHSGMTICEAYAWDVERNIRTCKVFSVRHERAVKGQVRSLRDPRDIYELVASAAARRVRSCLLSILPADVVDMAVEQCNRTIAERCNLTPERVKAMVDAFGAYGVTRNQIEARIQRRLDSMTPAQFVALGNIYNSLRDGMSQAGDWFAPSAAEAEREMTAAAIVAKTKAKEVKGEPAPTEVKEAEAKEEAKGERE